MSIQFMSSHRASLGVEMELEVIDPESRELVSGAREILVEMGEGHPGGVHPKAKPELLQSTIEIITGICQTVSEARSDLAATLGEVSAHAQRRGLVLMCSGSHPFSDPAGQDITLDPRYQRLVEEMQWPARQMQIFGIHVHVGVRSGEKAIAMVNALSFYIPHFLALSASSPYWMGHDTGLASCRSKVFEGLPTAGPPWQLDGWEQFERFMVTLIEARTIGSIREARSAGYKPPRIPSTVEKQMLMTSNRKITGGLRLPTPQRVIGWIATGVMFAVVVGCVSA